MTHISQAGAYILIFKTGLIVIINPYLVHTISNFSANLNADSNDPTINLTLSNKLTQV